MTESAVAATGRLAPSPTGVLHLGNARSFVLAWLGARMQGASLWLRIEDIDGPRVRAGAEQAVLDDLAWLGLDWDHGPIRQSDRLPLYRAALDRLLEAGQAFPCVCTRRDVEQAASAPHAGEDGLVYPGTCRERFSSWEDARPSGKPVAIRFRVPDDARVAWQDQVAGPQAYEVARQLGDFVIWKKDDEPAYQLAVVVDDADAGVGQVVRGDDLLPSAARQELLYQALGWSAPTWWHVPLVVGEDGRRLAKRHGDTSLRHLREQGATASQVLAWIARSCGLELASPPATAADLLPAFSWEALPREPVVWRGALDA